MTNKPFDWYDGALLETPGPGRVLLTSRRYPVFYLQILKCGCTFMRNLIWYLDHDAPHPAGNRVHAHDDEFLKAALIPVATLQRPPRLFSIVRDPVDRFLSLYWDKLANPDNQRDAGMRARVTKAAGMVETDDIDGHRANCLKALDWIGRNLDTRTEGKPNPHWQRQSVRLKQVEALAPKLLTLDGLSWQLPAHLSPVIPDIADKMAAVRVRNRSARPFTRDQIVTPEIEAAAERVYPLDFATYRRARDDWGPDPTKTPQQG